jgi:hypothetical protein
LAKEKIAKNSKWTGREKTKEIKIHHILSFHICVVTTYQHLAAFVLVPSVFGEKFTTVEF